MNFLVATDGSEQSERALDYAVDIAEQMGASMTAVYAVNPNIREDRPSDPVTALSDAERRLVLENIEDAEARGQQILDETLTHFDDHGIEGDTELLYGSPVDAISAYAEQGSFDGIFVGHRGLSADREGILGSVAKGLVDRASIPVTVVR